jgi:hypothetical protein
MKFLSFILLVLTFNAFASEKIILSCTTPGDALDDVNLIVSGDKAVIRVRYLDDSHHEFLSRTTLKNILKGEADTLIGMTSESLEFGGAISNSVLLRVLPGQKKAYLAKDGIVYFLTCRK